MDHNKDLDCPDARMCRKMKWAKKLSFDKDSLSAEGKPLSVSLIFKSPLKTMLGFSESESIFMVDAGICAIKEIMQDHPECLLYGQDVGKRLGGVFREAATLGETQSTVQLTITPDFIVREKDGELMLSMTKGNMPELRISDHYRDMLNAYKKSAAKKDKKEKETVQFIKQKIDSAQWFIEAIRQRQQTLEGTMHAIISIQAEFFKSGDEKKMAPMKLRDVAEITGLDESTISRVANSKFVLTEFGTKPLKYFFSESMQNADGEDVSTMEIKSTLKDLVSAEDKKKPLSDEKLKDLLNEKGYSLARRTVAKYREQLNIPVARLRKNV